MNNSKIGEERFKKIVEGAFRTPSKENDAIIIKERPKDWRDLQLKVKEIYENLGCEAKEDCPVKGARTSHKIDVLALFNFGGQKYRIVIECKYWNAKVKKAQVGTLLGILADIGAEKGIIVSKIGYQVGAYRLASYSNIELLTFDELKRDSERFIEKFKINYIFDKIRTLRIPFYRFYFKMREEALKKDLWWYPSEHGNNFSGSLDMLLSRSEMLDMETFPKGFIYSFVSTKKNEVMKVANNRNEYLDFILDNLKILEQEYKEFKEQIFSE